MHLAAGAAGEQRGRTPVKVKPAAVLLDELGIENITCHRLAVRHRVAKEEAPPLVGVSMAVDLGSGDTFGGVSA